MSHRNSYPIGGIDYPRNLQEFEEWFSTEKACTDYLWRLRWPEGFICPVCRGRKGWQMRTGLIRCTACQYKVPTISP